ncbi:MAG: hypothetical protein ABSA11_10690 [Candidatus Bathyarchaeia archaeon]|jgi:hypothetical protein
MRKVGVIYLALLVLECITITLLVTQRELILSDPTSNIIAWTTTWGGKYRDYAYGVAYANSSIFVTGASFSYGPGSVNLVLLKYNQNGTLLWNETYWERDFTMGRGSASDGKSLYISGIHIVENTSYSLLLKYDLDGRLIWAKEWRPGVDAKASGVALDKEGNIYVSGYVVKSALNDQEFLLKYSSNGDLLFSTVFDSQGPETAWGVSVSDAVYLCGEADYDIRNPGKLGEPATQMLLRKISLDGTPIWVREYSIGVNNVANAVDAKQEIAVAGYMRYGNGTAREVLLKYSSNGDLLSTMILGDSPIEDMAWGVAQAGDYTYIVGHTWTYLFLDTADATVCKIGPKGDLIWRDWYGGINTDRARAAAVNGNDVYVVGETYWEGLDMQIFVMKYVSPNTALDPQLSKALMISPLILGSLLLIIMIPISVEQVRKTRKRHQVYKEPIRNSETHSLQ